MDDVMLIPLFIEIQQMIADAFKNCVKVKGVPAAQSEYGERYRTFRLGLALSIEDANGGSPDATAVLVGAVKGALQAWCERGSGPVLVWRDSPDVRYVQEPSNESGRIVVRFRAHFMSAEAYEAAQKPKE